MRSSRNRRRDARSSSPQHGQMSCPPSSDESFNAAPSPSLVSRRSLSKTRSSNSPLPVSVPQINRRPTGEATISVPSSSSVSMSSPNSSTSTSSAQGVRRVSLDSALKLSSADR